MLVPEPCRQVLLLTALSFAACAGSPSARVAQPAAPSLPAQPEADIHCFIDNRGDQICGYHCMEDADGRWVCANTPDGTCRATDASDIECSELGHA